MAVMTPMMSFMNPDRLWWLAVPVAIALLYLVLAARRRATSGGSTNSILRRVLPRDAALKRHLSVLASVLSLASLVVAYARPQAMTQVPRERATIVVTIDVSRSMEATDVTPNRLDAAKSGAKDFVDSLPSAFNVALVTFAGTANVKMPPTTDRTQLKAAIDAIQLAPSTAIGEGIYTSLDVLEKLAPQDPDHPDDPAPGAIVLLSDGATNMGRDSADAATEAKKKNVPIYTIAYGTSTGYVVENGQRQTVAVNHAELSQVAKLSGGKKYSADSMKNLQAVYQTISRQIGYVEEYHEVTDRFAGIALIFAVLAAVGVISQAARWP
ncbi:VWA domain-containing protein [Propionibacterium freudenreichii]|uniref:VWA domain-containing protein n=1 Tax=Propionibacterium freudenreichii TaxID=1744 RepID=UPI0006DCCDC4|nr:VWA domain-containing protein [Propionibacterium freudenreichii]MDK9348317.1 VWA domain-containing protein [Propionibacterium freudenreichii]MDK9353442.1 VWA domain-containing protein [Propionibacterium freudenreichii]MDK9627841.1 VWA domain-containing protein [Propionibacterium freudenreichii]MDK9652230.1 VWA domain-containing protein [Propionibacterium freudenreichii]MDK9676302.1 VWA domain-containing protein [Propionibacterium freudenreichii]